MGDRIREEAGEAAVQEIWFGGWIQALVRGRSPAHRRHPHKILPALFPPVPMPNAASAHALVRRPHRLLSRVQRFSARGGVPERKLLQLPPNLGSRKREAQGV